MIVFSLMLMLHGNSVGEGALKLWNVMSSWICGRGKIQTVDKLPVSNTTENVLPILDAIFCGKSKKKNSILVNQNRLLFKVQFWLPSLKKKDASTMFHCVWPERALPTILQSDHRR
jgi:hypothetical protein